jgi:hypothetical protein
VQLPVTCAHGSALMAFYQADRELAGCLAADGSRTEPLGFAGRALLAVFAAEHHEGSLPPHRMLGLGVVVDSPWGSGRLPWAQLLRRADHRGVGFRLLGLAVSSAEAAAAYRELWGVPTEQAQLKLSMSPWSVRALATAEDGGRIGFGGLLGPGAPAALPDAVLFSRREGSTLRSRVDLRGRGSLRAGAGVRLAVSGPRSALAEQVRELGLDRSRPLLSLTARGLRARINAGAPLPGE